MLAIASLPALATMSAEKLAKLAQNPAGKLVSVPFQNATWPGRQIRGAGAIVQKSTSTDGPVPS